MSEGIMPTETQHTDGAARAKTKLLGYQTPRAFKVVALSLTAAVIFIAGMGVGNGSISIASSAEPQNKSLPANLDYASVEQVYDLLKANYDGKLDSTKLTDGIKGGLANATGDPYTMYFSKDEAKKFNDQLNGSFTGIGAELGEDSDSNLIIVSPIEGFPASKAGLRPQDVIVSIDGQSTSGMSIDKAISLIRGKKGTKVTLRILRDKSEDLSFTIARDDITVPSVTWKMLDDGIGYIAVSQFSEDTTNLMNRAGLQLKDKGAKRILLDLRGNPGGLLNAAVNIADMWLPKDKTIVQEKRGDVVTDTFTAESGGIFGDMPTAILINAGSASASEIVSGALHDNGAATLFGEKSYGKGSVQEIHDLPNGTEVKITVARWYRLNGQNIDKKGIAPDHAVKMTDDDYKHGRDPQKDAAIEFLKEK